jgi:hypothetical protein
MLSLDQDQVAEACIVQEETAHARTGYLARGKPKKETIFVREKKQPF